MAAPSISGGITVLESCDTGGASGKAPSSMLSGATIATATSLSAQFAAGLGGTGAGRIGNGAGPTNTVIGGIYSITSTDLSVSRRLLFGHFSIPSNHVLNNFSSSAGAMMIAHSSSTGTEEAAWSLFGNEIQSASYLCAVVNATRSADAYLHAGTFDETDVTHVGVAASWSNTFNTLNCETFGYVDLIQVINGETADKGTFQDVLDHISGNDALLNESPTGNIHHCFFSWGVGDNSTLTEFDETLKVFEFCRTFETATDWGRAHINDNDIGFEVNASASDIIALELCNFLGDTKFFWNSIGSTSATVTYTTCIIKNAGDVTIVDGHSFDGCTFDGCAEIDATQPTFTNTAFKNAAAAALKVGDNGDANMTNCTFTANQTAVKVDVVGNCSLDVTEFTFAASNTYFIEYTGTGTLTVTSPDPIAAGKLNASGGGTINVVAPTDDLTVNVNQSGCQIHVYTANTQTTLATEASAAQLVYTHSSETVDITVFKDGYIPYRQTNLTLSGDVTVTVQLSKSREYDSSHGLTYTTDASIYDNYSVITNITQANPAVVTYSGADVWTNNDIISIHDVVGMTEVNGKRYTVANVDTGANTFELSGINSTAYTAYSSAGIALSGLAVPTFGPSGRGVFSLLMEQFRTNSNLRNLPFNLEMDGNGSLYLTSGVEGEADADIENLTACGVGYLDVDATQTATWVGLESVGTVPAGATGEWTADDATTVTDARTTGVFDEVIKIHGDTDHGNFDWRANRIIAKMNVNGYREERVNVRELYGVSGNFTPSHFIIPIEPVAIDAATGDPSLSTAPTITDHGATPQSWNGKNFRITITDGATPNTGEGIIRYLNYYLRSANDTSFNSKDPFSWPEMMREVVAGTSYETIYGYTEDAQTSTLKGVRVVKSDGATAHPDFTRFQSDDGTYYVAPVTSQITITGMPTVGGSIRLQIHNETAKTASTWAATTAYSLGDKVLRTTGLGSEQTAGLYMVCTTAGTSGGSEPTWDTVVGNTTVDGTVVWTTYAILYYDDDPASASYNDTYTDNEEFADGDTYRIRFAELDGSTSFKTYESTGLVGATGFTVAISVTADSVYAANSIDGSSAAITAKFTADYTNDEIDLDANQDFAVTEAFAYYCYELTTSQGMYEFWGGVTAIDSANYRNNTSVVSIYFDETAGFVKQTDSARWYRDDDARPVIDPTTGGAGLELNWRNPVYQLETGVSGLTGSESTELFKNSTILTNLATVDANVDSILSDTNELQTDWADGGRLDVILDARASQASVDTVDGNVDLILADTADMQPKLGAPSTTIAGDIAALNDISSADVTAAVPTTAQIADKILNRNLGTGSDGGRTVQDALRANRNKVTVDADAGTITVYQEDDTTEAWSGTVTTGSRDPINDVDPS